MEDKTPRFPNQSIMREKQEKITFQESIYLNSCVEPSITSQWSIVKYIIITFKGFYTPVNLDSI